MLGTYRLFLALMVALQHLAKVPNTGAFAVFAFFIISGYLMTLILHQNYGYSTTGRFKYLVNRFLRIYPPFWGAALVSVVLLLTIDHSIISETSARMILTPNLKGILQNIFIAYNWTTTGRLVPPAWALSVEIFYYLLMALGISKSKRSTFVWVCASMVYTIAINFTHAGWDYIYFFFAAGSLPFSMGALLYHYRDWVTEKLGWLQTRYSPLVLFGLVMANYLIAFQFKMLKPHGFYVNLALNWLLVASLIKQPSLIVITKKIDKLFGDYSYPIYLLHVQAGVLVHYFTGWMEGGKKFALAATLLTFVLSWLLLTLVSNPIEKLRNRVKKIPDTVPYGSESPL